MTAVEGYRCDECHEAVLQEAGTARTSLGHYPSEPKTGWFVSECPSDGNGLRPLWFCCKGCVIQWMKRRCG